ncbi:hypothetical protein GCM10009678_50380 [Actinomadura kijaniata]|uniref:Lipoprotein n=1 Tax=Actinomadura namibiensis TaxID=182080 RepID=A0A7W3LIA2_ACTNM|nr:hypothetical protein [Actinomadura namibiensis]MBA8948590.1 hypothetical protein [Actinomadura namibiensis]
MRILALATATALLTTALTTCLPSDGSSGGSGGSGGPGKAATAVDKGDGPKAPDPGKPVVKTTVNTSDGPTELAVVGLNARGRLAHLTMMINTANATGVGDSLYTLNGGEVPAVSLLDPVNLKRYVVVKDSAGTELGAGNAYVRAAKPTALSYTFPAPPENVQAVDVQFGRLTTFRNVPVER